ncbi:MAG: helix-turn-helix domain-containing protein [Butyrivibrio sp.]
MEKEIDYTALGMRIRKSRTQQHMTQEQLGELCELSTAHIGHIERGTRVPSLETIFRIAQALNVSMDSLMFDSLASDENIIPAIQATLSHSDKRQIKRFISVVKILADRIDDL